MIYYKQPLTFILENFYKKPSLTSKSLSYKILIKTFIIDCFIFIIKFFMYKSLNDLPSISAVILQVSIYILPPFVYNIV